MSTINLYKIGVPVKGKIPLAVTLQMRWAQFWHAAGQARRIRALENEKFYLQLEIQEMQLEIEDQRIRLRRVAQENHDLKISLAKMEGKRK